MKRNWRRALVFIALIAAVAVVVPVFMESRQGDQQQSQQRPRRRGGGGSGDPISILAATARLADVPVYIEGVGTARPANTVTVKPQVDGQLTKILFEEGQEVRKGDLLATIDPTIYQAQLEQAQAKKAQDEAQLDNARRDLERYSRLAESNSVTKQQADTQRATVAQLEALVKADQAAIDNAKAMLAYTRITAPIAGKTGIRTVDEGNIVRASEAAGLVVISQIQPIAVVFSVPQQQLARINKARALGPLRVDAMDADNKAAVDTGVLNVVDNQVDQTTGTVRLKAEFPNADLALWPGAFANVRLLVETLRQAVVVPTGAVQRGPKGTFVYIVKDDETVTVRPVQALQQDDLLAVVTTGLQPGERVAATSFSQLAEGTKITVAGAPAAEAPEAVAGQEPVPNASPAPAPRGERQRPATAPAGGGAPRAATPAPSQ